VRSDTIADARPPSTVMTCLPFWRSRKIRSGRSCGVRSADRSLFDAAYFPLSRPAGISEPRRPSPPTLRRAAPQQGSLVYAHDPQRSPIEFLSQRSSIRQALRELRVPAPSSSSCNRRCFWRRVARRAAYALGGPANRWLRSGAPRLRQALAHLCFALPDLRSI